MRIAALIVVVLAGCAAPGGELADARGSWDGATYDEVVLRWGAPARSSIWMMPFGRRSKCFCTNSESFSSETFPVP